MNTLQLICLGAGLLAYYYLVLRRYNTLGFRLFSLFAIVSLAVCYWWHLDYQRLKEMQRTGISVRAVVLSKSTHLVEPILQLHFMDPSGKWHSKELSGSEFTAIQTGDTVSVLYSPFSNTVYLTGSYQRRRNSHPYILIVPAILLLIGVLCCIYLSKFRIQPHTGTIFEYLTDENGQVLYDTRRSSPKASFEIKFISRVNQLFQRQ